MKKVEKKILSEKEQRRLENFEKISGEMEQQGYVRQNLTINITKANILSIFLMMIVFVTGCVLYYLFNHRVEFSDFNALSFLVYFIILVVIHEMIHGACWVIFSPGRFKDIEFGVMKPSFCPYCTCLVPLKKWQYMVGVMMPGLILGVIPFVFSVIFANPFGLFMASAMIAIAAGDLMIFRKIAKYNSKEKEVVYMDHPTDAGGVIFER